MSRYYRRVMLHPIQNFVGSCCTRPKQRIPQECIWFNQSALLPVQVNDLKEDARPRSRKVLRV